MICRMSVMILEIPPSCAYRVVGVGVGEKPPSPPGSPSAPGRPEGPAPGPTRERREDFLRRLLAEEGGPQPSGRATALPGSTTQGNSDGLN